MKEPRRFSVVKPVGHPLAVTLLDHYERHEPIDFDNDDIPLLPGRFFVSDAKLFSEGLNAVNVRFELTENDE